MKKKQQKKFFWEIYHTSLFLFFVGIFLYSVYNIVQIKGWSPTNIVSANQSNCGECGDCGCLTPTQRPTPTLCQPTPTPTQSCEPTPTPTPTDSCQPTPTPTPTSTVIPTPTPTPNPTAIPTSPPSVGGNGDGGGGGGGGGQVCGLPAPTTPTLNSVSRLSATTVSLQWSAASPVNHYSISYGLSGQGFQYGVVDTGNITNYIIGGLAENQNYCFAVAGVNDCMPGALSNTVCINYVGGRVLGASTLGATGSSNDLMKVFFIVGALCLGLGIKSKNSLV